MLLVNETAFDAKFVGIRLPTQEDAIGMLLVKATYDLHPDGKSFSVAPDPFPITTETVETPFGVFHGEVNPPHEGADVCVLGTVRRARRVREAVVTLRLSGLASSLRVIGDRVWRRSGRSLAPSDPAPFDEMPLSYRRAYGGEAEHEAGKVPWPDNPIGVGYYLSEAQALGRPLPNIEPVNLHFAPQWNRPVPVVGWAPYPNTWALRIRQAYEMEGTRLKRVNRTLFNNAHPSLVVPALAPGDRLRLEGLLDEPREYSIPAKPIVVRTTIGQREIIPRIRIDGFYLWVDERKAVVMYRAVFSYPVQRGEPRRTVVTQ